MEHKYYEIKATPKTLESENNVQLVVDSIYLVIRLLRNYLRGHENLAISLEVGPNAANLAKQVIKDIEIAEGKSIDQLDEDAVVDYIITLERHQSERVLEGRESTRSEKVLLEEMRRQAI